MKSFSELGLSEPLMRVFPEMGYEKPSPIQEQAIPLLKEKAQDFIGLAQSFGFLGISVKTTDEFSAAFSQALSSENGAVLDLHVSSESLVPRQSLSEIRQMALNNQTG